MEFGNESGVKSFGLRQISDGPNFSSIPNASGAIAETLSGGVTNTPRPARATFCIFVLSHDIFS